VIGANASTYGRTYWGALRATFVIGPDGVVAHVIPRVTPRTMTTRFWRC
jgi:thioredoxin-dependent peroxiredoxin